MPGEFIARNGMISRGNVVVTGSLTTSGSLTTTGTITATTLVVQTITSSISSITGSTNFGSLAANTHTFTGSILTSGSVGIGIGNPNSPLEVYAGSGSVFRAIYNGVNNVEIGNYKPTPNGGGGYQQLDIASSQINLLTGTAGGGSATSRMSIASSGAVTFNGNVVLSQGYGISVGHNVSSNSYVQFGYFSADARSRTWRISSDFSQYGDFSIAQATTAGGSTYLDKLTITYQGYVGLGESAPWHKLIVKTATNNNFDLYDNGTGIGIQSVSEGNVNYRTMTIGASILTYQNNNGTILTFNSNGSISWTNATYMISGTAGYRFNNSTDAFNNFVALDNGNATLRGTLTQNSSDERLKNNIQIIPNALNKINQLRGVTFEWNQEIYETSRTTDIGVIAQDVQSVLPDAVTLAPFDTNFDNNTSKSGENYLTVYYEKLIPLLIEGIKELTARVQYLENK